MTTRVRVGSFEMGDGNLTLIAGPCAIESVEATVATARELRDICAKHGVNFIFKTSFDKANRTSLHSYRGVGVDEGLSALARVREEVGVPVLTDVHETREVKAVADVVDVVQIPAFLCRQTDLLLAAGESGKVVNIKKAQFLSPPELWYAVEKVQSCGNEQILVTERGTMFGYNNLVVDFCSLPQLREFGYPVIFDATHSVQMPGALGTATGGRRQYVPYLARAAAAVGVDALFMEVHPDPDHAPSDGPNMLRLSDLDALLRAVIAIRDIVGTGDDVENA